MKFYFKQYVLLATWLFSSTVSAALINHTSSTVDLHVDVVSEQVQMWLPSTDMVTSAMAVSAKLAPTEQNSFLDSTIFNSAIWLLSEEMSTTFSPMFGDTHSTSPYFVSLFSFNTTPFETRAMAFTNDQLMAVLFSNDVGKKSKHQKTTAVNVTQQSLSDKPTSTDYARNDSSSFTSVELVTQTTPISTSKPSTIVLVLLTVISLLVNSQHQASLV